MKIHKNLEELLDDYNSKLLERWTSGSKQDFSEFVNDYLSSNSLASSEPRPLAKNKQCDDDFFCEWSVAHDMDNQKCDAQCIYCKSH